MIQANNSYTADAIGALKANAVLVPASRRFIPSYIEALHDGFFRGDGTPKTIDEINDIQNNPAAFLEKISCQDGTFTVPTGEVFRRVPHEPLWLCAADVFIGEVSFRHELNDPLKQFGGHIGYGIRPVFQGHGFATLAVQRVRKRALKMGIEQLLVTCSPENTASKRVILKNGGVYRDTLEDPYGHGPTARYWVKTALSH